MFYAHLTHVTVIEKVMASAEGITNWSVELSPFSSI